MTEKSSKKKRTLLTCVILASLLIAGCGNNEINTTHVVKNSADVSDIRADKGYEGDTKISTTDVEQIPAAGQTAAGEGAGAATQTDGAGAAEAAGEGENVRRLGPVVISEILSSNSKYMEHNGKFCDMIELANISEEDVDLEEYHISDSLSDPMKARLKGSIEKGGFAVFYCVGDGADIESNELPFKISASGETIVLTKGDGDIAETVDVPKLERNMGYARNGNGEFELTGRLTFGGANEFGNVESVLPGVSPKDGTRSEGPVYVTFTPCDGTTLYYTTNGSMPGTSSRKYNEPIEVKKTATIRVLAVADEDPEIPSETASYTYFVGEPDATLDDLCVGIADGDFSDLNAHPKKKITYPISVAMYHEGNKVFDETCGMKANGNTSVLYEKKSYRLKFSKKYGESRLRFKVFDDLDTDSFDSLVLRGGSQDNEDIMMKDELVPIILRQGKLVNEVLTTRCRPVNLYIDGEYRGLYYIREHIDASMIASHYGCDDEDVTLIEQNREIKSGSAGKEWLDLWDYIDKNDLKNKEAYDHVASAVSLESVADYYIIQIWLDNIDPDNVRVYKAGDDKWRYALYDLDLTLNDNGSGGSSFLLGRYNRGLYTFNALVYKLLENPDFMEFFLSRMQLLFTTVLSEKSVIPIVDSFTAKIDHDMERSCDRWSAVDDPSGAVYYIAYPTWKRRVEKFKSRLAGRTAVVASEFASLKGVSAELADKYLAEIIK
ncbi:MAG: CotH kinase family protein [Lachnospiraceae bacterium]|nr:CotH kinase family protein [Lachnospiraceae bacterium]